MSNILSNKAATEQFITRWKTSGASERENYQLFLTELCDLLGVEKPRPASDKVHEAFYTSPSLNSTGLSKQPRKLACKSELNKEA